MKAFAGKYKNRLFVCALCVLILLGSVGVSAEAQIPYESYTYWKNMSDNDSRKAVYTKPVYHVSAQLDASAIGAEAFTGLTDIFVGGGKIYLLDGAASRLLVLDSNYHLLKEYSEMTLDGKAVSFAGAQGVFTTGSEIYLCDSDNGRVLIAGEDGVVRNTIEKPDSALIPKDFKYRPVKSVVDSQGYIYVLSEGSFYGALLFSPERDFIGFFGANKVTPGVSEVMSNIWARIFPNNSKASASARVLPYSMADLCVTDDDFIYTVTGSVGTGDQTGQIRKLYSGNGSDILNANSVNFADEGYNTTSRLTGRQLQDLCSIDVDDDGFIYSLDSTYGRVFMYDKTGTMISAFGGGFGNGNQAGTFKTAKNLAVNGNDLLVLDSTKNTVTVFSQTELCKLIKQGRTMTLRGEYEKSADIWQKVLSLDRNYQVAYCGMARAYYALGNYDKALDFARQGYDRDTYALAFSEMRVDFLSRNFWVIFMAIAVIAAALAIFAVVKRRKKIVLIKNGEFRLMTSTLFHPIDTFTTIKEKHRGSVGLSIGLLAVFYLLSIISVLCGGFMFTYYDASSFNSIWVLIRSIGFVVLWIAANWLVCSLMGGNGRIREITIVVCYSLIPLILNQVIRLALTNVMLPGEAAFLIILNVVAYLIFFLMMTFGSMTIHEYSFGKFIGTALLSVLGMAIVIFLVILIGILLQQFVGFVWTVVMELTM